MTISKKTHRINGHKIATVGRVNKGKGRCRRCTYDDTHQANARRKAKKRAMIKALKLEKGCLICGYNKCAAALSFHHRDPATKRFDVSAASNYGYTTLRVEIDKCDILCANCHAEQTEGDADATTRSS